MNLTTSDIRRFWMKVRAVSRGYKTQCWEFQGKPTSAKGYRQFNIAGRPWLAHHVGWYIFGRPLPRPPNCLCHHCDNPACVRYTHMFVGTRAENNADMRRKGRGSAPPIHRGEQNPASKLTITDVEDIRALAGTQSQRQLARDYGVSRTTIKHIQNKETWRH